MRVIGIDPGSRKTGFGVVEKRGNVYRCVAQGTASASARLGMPQRIHAIVRRIHEVIEAETPDCMAVEEAFYHESVRSTLVLGHVRGAILVAGIERGLEVSEYTPREVKLSVAGNGGASKEQVEFMVKRMLALKGTLGADASDALAVALCHLHRSRRIGAQASLTVATRGLEALLARRVRRS
jgi:crossover junction endodeoxyribonuclease RuvC